MREYRRIKIEAYVHNLYIMYTMYITFILQILLKEFADAVGPQKLVLTLAVLEQTPDFCQQQLQEVEAVPVQHISPQRELVQKEYYDH